MYKINITNSLGNTQYFCLLRTYIDLTHSCKCIKIHVTWKTYKKTEIKKIVAKVYGINIFLRISPNANGNYLRRIPFFNSSVLQISIIEVQKFRCV